MDFSKKFDNPSPEETANPISKLFYCWHYDLFRQGLRKDLEMQDTYRAQTQHCSEILGDELDKNWSKEIKRAKAAKRKPKFVTALYATFWKTYCFWGVFLFIYSCVLRSIQPKLLAVVISYFNEGNTMTKQEGYIYAAALLGIIVLTAVISNHTFTGLFTLGMRVRVACCSVMYRKLLRLSQGAMGEIAVGKIVNLMSNDVGRFDNLLLSTHYIWIMPFALTALSILMYETLGWAAFAGISIVAIQSLPIQGWISKRMAYFRLAVAQRTDERIRVMNEIVGGIQVIKLYAWEKPFERIVRISRKNEINKLLTQSYFRGFSSALSVYTERLSLYASVVAFVLLGNNISSDKVFTMAQYFNILQLYLSLNFPTAINSRAEALITAKRIEEFLLMEEKEEVSEFENNIIDEYKIREEKDGGVELRHIYSSWNYHNIVPTLSDISFKLKPGQLCAVIGPVGSGKSSILQLLLRELPVRKGVLHVGGQVAYSSQEPWLFQGSVRNNILFGEPYNKHRYQATVRACALVRDFEQFPHGDQTLVGDRGALLSGGQKARVNLARAVYRNADIYLFDDPLSAVDTHVAKHLYEKCIGNYVKSKTRILVTHQLHFLKDADLIIFLDNGRLMKMGTWDEISKDATILESLKASQQGLEVTEEEVTPEAGAEVTRLKRLYSTISAKSDAKSENQEQEETAELIEKGSLAGKTFWEYLLAGGGVVFLVSIIFLLVVAQVVCSGSDWWYTRWTNMEHVRRIYLEQLGEYNYTDVMPLNITTYINETVVLEDPFLSRFVGITVISQWWSIYVYSGLIFATVFLLSISRLLCYKLAMNASIALHDTMFNNVLQATMSFFDTNPGGRILNRFSKDMGSIDEILPKALIDALQIFLVMFGIFGNVAIINPYLLIAIGLAGYFYNKVRVVYLKTAQNIRRLEMTARSPGLSKITASFDGITTIRACGTQPLLVKEFDVQQNVHTGVFYSNITAAQCFGLYLDCISMTLLATITLSFIYFDDGSTFGGNVGLAISQTMILTGMLQFGIRASTDVLSQLTSVERVLQYSNLEKEGPFESVQKPRPTWPESGKIEFKHTYLTYNPELGPVLKDLNITINPGDKVGIVGRTGAGKSTLISALFRLAPLDGEILIDHIDTQSIGLTDLRSRISIIPQTPVLFSASLRENLDPFNKSDDAAIWQALEDVELKDIADSLDHKISEGGNNLSVGQRQLLCLARAIIRNNRVLVLDEATANVDIGTDTLIQNTIRTKFAKCTVLTIAHRLNTIMDSDKVLVLDDGRMMEYDHPHKLLEIEEGYFSKMVAETGPKMETQLRQIAKDAYDQKIKLIDE